MEKQDIKTKREVIDGVDVISVVKTRPFIERERFTRDQLVQFIEYYKSLLEQFDSNKPDEVAHELPIIK